MTSRSIIFVGFVALCGAALWGLLAQGRQLSELRAEQTRLESLRPATSALAAETRATDSPTPAAPRELLQLRAEVARLSQQQRELSGVRAENERLRLQLEDRRTNSAARKGAAYIRKSEAKWVGYNTPEDTLQSLFWAAQNHNLEKFLEAVTPEGVEELKSLIGLSDNSVEAANKFFDKADFPAGFQIIGREKLPDGTMALTVQIVVPESGTESEIAVDSSEPFRFEQVAGQWKLGKPH